MNYQLTGHSNHYVVENTIQIFFPFEQCMARTATELTYVESGVTPTETYATLFVAGREVAHHRIPPTTGFYDWAVEKIADRDIKHCVYQVLANHTGKSSPWGLLTGIRPIKLVRAINERAPGQAYTYLSQFYGVSEGKARQAVSTYTNQQRIIDSLTPTVMEGHPSTHDVNLYINIPFCPTKCSYCSFTAYAIDYDKTERYMDALLNELTSKAELIASRRINSVYIGGGTPTSITSEKMERLLSAITERFDLSTITEFTVEAGRPDTINERKLAVMKRYGVSRISINPQTTNPATLEALGRHHSVDDFYRAFTLARAMGFDNINTDIIIGLTGETVADVERTMQDILPLQPENITVHTLAIKKGAKLRDVTLTGASDDLEAQARQVEAMQAMAERYLQGYEPYYLYRNKKTLGNTENIGYAKASPVAGEPSPYIANYNIQTMEDIQDIIALGCGAVSKTVTKDGISRTANNKDLDGYLRDWLPSKV